MNLDLPQARFQRAAENEAAAPRSGGFQPPSPIPGAAGQSAPGTAGVPPETSPATSPNPIQLAIACQTLNELAGHVRDLQLDLINLRRIRAQVPADQRNGIRNALNQLSDQCRDAATAL